MTPDQHSRPRTLGETPRLGRAGCRNQGEIRAAVKPEEPEDWPLTSALIGGLFLTILFNTFVALLPG